ncbi:hypothetical protein A2837_00965 [Candidatus Kaiserbacteria bacterium RIFCSPHIGHO2_01_FULL_46_22]|uniref:Uncharacterized protein n=1 Tax=Candidatus Kaiserbacteria bacterium RIFCSPHIGHO2_01_FULL_46_22 TaxID=1798475 RepID=A0A1F6BXU5_9BACT|nr:MAG: hypothetical protein A2837_00965 [Candidatus Kaiserbacteria bacterium RIFCSPHIGHO2_01_FULL_46_22]
MIRTRDFLLFGAVVLFLFTGLSVTVLMDAWQEGGQLATVVEFERPKEVAGAEAEDQVKDYEGNAERLRGKIAQGEGIVAGGPVFTSVDDLMAASSTTITDQTAPTSILIGQTMDGSPLSSDELWRYVGFTQTDQIGVAINGYPIFGSHSNVAVLDACGGVDEGSGYRYYIQPGKEVAEGCFVK